VELSRLQREAIEILVVGSDRWKADQSLVADAIAGALRWTLAFVVTMDGTRTGWAFELIRRLEAGVLEASTLAAAPRQ
jgi:hypothetical protein